MNKKVIALDIGGTNTRAALVDSNFNVVRQVILPTIKSSSEDFAKQVKLTIEKLEVDFNDVIAIGAGVPGVLNRSNGYIYDLPNVHVKDIALGEYLTSTFHVPSFIRNDAEVACLAEAHLGKGKDYSRVFFITISTGLGGAFCVDGLNQDYITEIGHTAYFYKDKWSEYELLASGSGLVRLAKLNNLEIKDAKELFALIKANNPTALKIYNDWLKIMSSFIKMIQDSYHPEIITFTGGVMRDSNYFFADFKKNNPDSNMTYCEYGENAGTIGAAIYAFQMASKEEKQ